MVKETILIHIKPTHPKFTPAKVPRQCTQGSAGYDLFLNEDLFLAPKAKDHLVPLGFQLSFSPHFHGLIKSRSSTALKHGLEIFPGVIDSDYDGTVSLLVSNKDHKKKFFPEGTRLAQIIFHPTVKQMYSYVPSTVTTEAAAAAAREGVGSSKWNSECVGEKWWLPEEGKTGEHLGWGSTGCADETCVETCGSNHEGRYPL